MHCGKRRAKDLKDAFLDDSIAGIICAIGGDDTYRLLPYLMEDATPRCALQYGAVAKVDMKQKKIFLDK